MAIHVIKGDGPPTIAPKEIGMHYIDETNKVTYTSAGLNIADWVLGGDPGSSFSTFTALLDTPASYPVGSAGQVPKVGVTEDHLVFDNVNVDELGDVDQTAKQDLSVLSFKDDVSKWLPEFRMKWRNTWAAGIYKTMEVVRDGNFAMVANKETTDRAAPQRDGDTIWALPDVPTFTSDTDTPYSLSGAEFSITSTVVIDGLRVWIPSTDPNTNYVAYITEVTNPADPIILATENIPSTVSGWVDISTIAGTFVEAGRVLRVTLLTFVSVNDIEWDHSWLQGNTVATIPASQEYARDGGFTQLLINKNDFNLVDRSSDLALLDAGATITIQELGEPTRFDTYQVQSIAVDQGTYYQVIVIRTANGSAVRNNQEVTIAASIVGSLQPAPLVTIPNWWFDNDALNGGATAKGFRAFTEPPFVYTDDAHGVDIRGTILVESPDWDIMSFTSNTGAGGGGGGAGASLFTELLDTPAGYAGNANLAVRVNEFETGLTFVDIPNGVESFNTREGDVLPLAGDYSASDVGADTSAEVDVKVSTSMIDHLNTSNPHPQYLLPNDVPGNLSHYLEDQTSTENAAYKISTDTPNDDASSNVSMFTAGVGVLVPFQNWMDETDAGLSLPIAGSNVRLTLDVESTSANVEIVVNFGIYNSTTTDFTQLGSVVYDTIVAGRFLYNNSSKTPDSTPPIQADDRTYFDVFIRRIAAGPEVELTLHYAGDYDSVQTNIIIIPGAFTELRDTPSSYASEGLKLLRVNAGETGVEYVDPVSVPVQSVFGRTGAVDAQAGDYDADEIDDAATTNKFATQGELDQIGNNTFNIGVNTGDIGDNALDIGNNATAIGNNTTAIGNNATAIDDKEDDLGDPATDGEFLTSTAAGVRSWAEVPPTSVVIASGAMGGAMNSGTYTLTKTGNLITFNWTFGTCFTTPNAFTAVLVADPAHRVPSRYFMEYYTDTSALQKISVSAEPNGTFGFFFYSNVAGTASRANNGGGGSFTYAFNP